MAQIALKKKLFFFKKRKFLESFLEFFGFWGVFDI